MEHKLFILVEGNRFKVNSMKNTSPCFYTPNNGIISDGPYTKQEMKQLLIKYENNDDALWNIIDHLETKDPQCEPFVSGLKKAVQNPEAMKMVIRLFAGRIKL